MKSPLFESVKVTKPKRSNFDLSHDNKLTCDMGYLIPTLCQEVLPSDEFKLDTSHLVKFMPLVSPIMHKVDIYFHNFFVPCRLLNSHWEDFITGGEDGTYSGSMPYFTYKNIIDNSRNELLYNGSLLDYLGLPTFGTDSSSTAQTKITAYANNKQPISMLPILAYNLIYDEYYRDQNLQTKTLDKANNPAWFNANGNYTNFFTDTAYSNLFKLRRRAWKKDYFTSALPWAQKGTPVSLTMTGQVPVVVKSDVINSPDSFQDVASFTAYGVSGDNKAFHSGAELSMQLNSDTGSQRVSQARTYVFDANDPDLSVPSYYDPHGTLVVNASDFNVATINELRFAFRAQEWLEKSARGGSRYIEQILSHFGIMGKDARLQRPEYLGGSVNGISISENLQTSESGTTPIGYQSGQGTSVNSDFQFSRYFDEHGYIIQIMSIMPKATYQNGLARMWTRLDKLDYAFPEFGNLGEQEILKQEVNYLPSTTTDTQTGQEVNGMTFGYTPRYAEYKFALDAVHGEFKNTLAFWHLGRNFGTSVPMLNGDFIQCNPRTDIFAVEQVQTEGICSHHILVELYHHLTAARPLPFFGTPTF